MHKKYEFGCKVGIVTSSRDNWVFGAQAFHGNPYDGHTLKDSLKQMEELTGWKTSDSQSEALASAECSDRTDNRAHEIRPPIEQE